MKLLLLVFLMLSTAFPADADVFVYNWKEKVDCYFQSGAVLQTWKENHKGYVIIETDDKLPYAYALYIDTTSGENKLMWYWEAGFEPAEINIDNKIYMVLSDKYYSSSPSLTIRYQVLLTAEVKSGTAAKFSGTEIWREYRDGNKLFRTPRASLVINKKWTTVAQNEGFTAEQARVWIGQELMKKGYEWN
ncbi:MAG: hypothetical protein JW749_04015 [Sedimentisphaerales bacterium]|nr:hypothetical protein [Sedimentisphaerales bacterium]